MAVELWCDYQTPLDNGVRVACTAHLADGRVLVCPYQSNEDRLKSLCPCCDYKREFTNVRDKIKDGFIGIIYNYHEGWETPAKEAYPESANALGGSDGTIQTGSEV